MGAHTPTIAVERMFKVLLLLETGANVTSEGNKVSAEPPLIEIVVIFSS